MLWLKGWLETRGRIGLVLFMSVILFGTFLEKLKSASVAGQPRLILALWGISVLLTFLAAVMLAGSGIQTVVTRMGHPEKSGEESILFTLSLPVTRTRLFLVRTAIGVLETVTLLALFTVVVWFLAPPLTVNVHDVHGVLGFFATLLACSVVVYAVSACLSTFCDEAWRFGLSVVVLVVLFVLAGSVQRPSLAKAATLPRSMDIFRQAIAPLSTHQIPWMTIIVACVVAVLFFAAAVTIIHRRDY